jgi:hypothetical protein
MSVTAFRKRGSHIEGWRRICIYSFLTPTLNQVLYIRFSALSKHHRRPVKIVLPFHPFLRARAHTHTHTHIHTTHPHTPTHTHTHTYTSYTIHRMLQSCTKNYCFNLFFRCCNIKWNFVWRHAWLSVPHFVWRHAWLSVPHFLHYCLMRIRNFITVNCRTVFRMQGYKHLEHQICKWAGAV